MVADRPRAVAILTFDGAQSLDVTGPLEAFAQAIECARRRGLAAPYTIEILAERPGPVRTMSGLRILADRGYARVKGGIDTLIVSGGDIGPMAADVRLHRWLQAMARRTRRLASPSGATSASCPSTTAGGSGTRAEGETT